MSRHVLAFAFTLLVAPGLSRADPPAAPQQPMLPPQPEEPQPEAAPLDVFLEQRVAEELAAGGMLLSRLGATLDIEVIEQRAIISLVDPATRRALASTKIDVLPADREVAVASVTQVAASLAAQLMTPASQTTMVVKEMLDRDREERREREAAEYRFRQEAITFGHEVEVSWTSHDTSARWRTHDTSARRLTHSMSVRRRWIAYQGDIRRRLEGEEFYKVINRLDLAEQYRSRRNGGSAAMVIGGLVGTGGLVIMLTRGFARIEPCYLMSNEAQCERDQDARDREARQNLVIGTVVALAGAIPSLIGVYYYRHAHPISEAEAQTLGAEYNAGLRRKHNLSTDAAPRWRPRLRDVAITPYMDGGGGGLALGGRF